MFILGKILKDAPTGLALYDVAIKDTVYLSYLITNAGTVQNIICEQRSGDIVIQRIYNERGVTEHSWGMNVLLPAEGASWEDWQNILFPKSVRSYIIDNTSQKKYRILPENFVIDVNSHKTMPMSFLDLRNFSYTDYNPREDKTKQTIEVIKSGEDNEFDFKEFDKVLVKNTINNLNDLQNVWNPAIFGFFVKTPHGVMYMANSKIWEECIPYNKHTAHLIGTDQTFDKNLIKSVKAKKKRK